MKISRRFMMSFSASVSLVTASFALCALAQVENDRPRLNAEAHDPQGMPELRIGTMPEYVQGFPVILRLVAKGPLSIPRTSLFSAQADVDVVLSSKKDDHKYIIRSAVSRGEGMVVMGPTGGRVSGSILLEGDPRLAANTQASLLLDLSSISNYDPNGVSLREVPAGKYDVYVTLRQQQLEASVAALPIQLELKDPSPKEKVYLNDVRELLLKSVTPRQRRRLSVDDRFKWVDILSYATALDSISSSEIGEVAKAQISYHLMLSKILSFEGSIKDFDEKVLDQIKVPAYLEPEKKSLMLEIQLLSGKEQQIQNQLEELLRQEPAIGWRIKQAQLGKVEYLKK